MSVQLLVGGIPTVVASSDTLLANFRITEHIHFLAIWGDWDKAGVEHASALYAWVREQGRRAVCIFPQYEIPRKHKIDWNDALQYFGVEQLRRQSFYRANLNGLKEKLSGAGFMQAAERIGNIAQRRRFGCCRCLEFIPQQIQAAVDSGNVLLAQKLAEGRERSNARRETMRRFGVILDKTLQNFRFRIGKDSESNGINNKKGPLGPFLLGRN